MTVRIALRRSSPGVLLAMIAMIAPARGGDLAYAPAPADNPLKGFVPYQGQGADFPHSMEFQYLPLADLMAGPEEFTWEPMERLLNTIAGRGCQAVVRVFLEYPGKPTGVPKYLIDSGVTLREWLNTNTQPFPPKKIATPDYEDPRLRSALASFIKAFGARYDGDPRLGSITAGLLGTWGEWHDYPHDEWFASKTVQNEVMDAYEAAFQKTPVLLRYPAGEDDFAHAPNARRNLGYHDDSFAWATLDTGKNADDWFFMTALKTAGPEALTKWRTRPIGGEIRPELWPCLWTDSGCDEGQDYARSVAATHATWLMDSSTSKKLPAKRRDRAIAAARLLGYELHARNADLAISPDGRTFSVTMTIENRGVAPFYATWPMEVCLLGAEGRAEATWPTDWMVSGLQPDDLPRVLKFEKADAGLTPGRHKVLVRVVNPLKGGKPLRFANEAQDADSPGWLSLGEISR